MLLTLAPFAGEGPGEGVKDKTFTKTGIWRVLADTPVLQFGVFYVPEFFFSIRFCYPEGILIFA